MRKKYERGIEKLNQIDDVSNLYTLDKNLYYRVFRRAKKKGMSVGTFLNELGHDYAVNKKRSKSITDEELIQELLEKYPDRRVERLSTDKRLYKLISNRAKAAGQSVEEWLEERDFEYIKSTKGYVLSDLDIKLLLWELYPGGVIQSLSSKDRVLYQRIKRRSKDVKKYCEKLGFKYLSR